MLISFTLSMPSNNSWNGKWSGENDLYCIIKNFPNSKKIIEKIKPILEKGYYSYDFGDGWTALISIKKIDSKEARKLRSKSKGFCGYSWMAESIINYGSIKTESQIKELKEIKNVM